MIYLITIMKISSKTTYVSVIVIIKLISRVLKTINTLLYNIKFIIFHVVDVNHDKLLGAKLYWC